MSATNKQRQLINDAFSRLPETYHGFATCRDLLLSECTDAERKHRSGRPATVGFSAQLAGKYFAVKYLLDAVRFPERMPSAADYLSFRHEIFTAYAIVSEALPQFTAWAESVPMEFDCLDYCKLMGD
jgi:hypothetical protein